MKLILIYIFIIYIMSTYCEEVFPNFPKDFKIGSASSAYQVEGAYKEDDKSLSIWDIYTHKHPEKISDYSNGDVSANSYHFYMKDVEALKFVGFHHYRFSISWSRVLINGSVINPKGIDYYNRLIDSLLENNIHPVVTLYHWDLPQSIQDIGGFLNPNIVRYFKYYANILFEKFGDRVTKWITFNEPYKFCIEGYGIGTLAPGVKLSGIGDYLCGHHVLQAHAAVYHLYKTKYYSSQKGEIGIALVTRSFYVNNKSEENLIDDMQNFQLGWFANPIYGRNGGGYPKVMIDKIGENSKREGRKTSRLPIMSDEMKSSLSNSADFLALNYYTSNFISPAKYIEDEISYQNDAGVRMDVDKNWVKAESSQWLYSVPRGMHDLLVWIKENYNNPEVLITENGFSDFGEIEDEGRVSYIRSHLEWTSKAIGKGCNVVGYTCWSLIDNFEWLSGYTEKFGVFSVNFSIPEKTRTPKKSAEFLKKLISQLNKN